MLRRDLNLSEEAIGMLTLLDTPLSVRVRCSADSQPTGAETMGAFMWASVFPSAC
jgi:hypothetical protein